MFLVSEASNNGVRQLNRVVRLKTFELEFFNDFFRHVRGTKQKLSTEIDFY